MDDNVKSNTHVEMLLSDFNENIEALNIMKDFVLEFLNTKICVENKMLVEGIEGRVKTQESLRHKLEIKGHKYKTLKDLTDLVGARVITFYSDEVDRIANIIEKYFIIDYENSIDKRKIYDVDRFGYMSLHYICSIPKDLYFVGTYPQINEFRFEIQMRTCLQHVWATIFHDIGYKTDIEVPREYIRRLARLEGLFEIADDEFLNIRNSITNYRSKINSLVSKGRFEDVSLSIDSYKLYINLNPYKELEKRIASITGADIAEGSYERYYKVFVEFGITMLNEIEQMRINNEEDAYWLAFAQLHDTDIDIVSSTVAIQNILVIYTMKQEKDREKIKEKLSKIYGQNNITESFVDKLIEQTRAIVMI